MEERICKVFLQIWICEIKAVWGCVRGLKSMCSCHKMLLSDILYVMFSPVVIYTHMHTQSGLLLMTLMAIINVQETGLEVEEES